MRGELHKDPMRLISVADAHETSADDLPASEVYFAVNRKKHPVMVSGKLVRSQAEQRGLYQLLECIPPLSPQYFLGTLNFQLTPASHEEKLPVKDRRWNLQDIVEACNAFYQPLLRSEIELLDKQAYLDSVWQAKINHLLENMAVQKKTKTFILRLGRHSGAEAMTLNGVRNIKIMQRGNEKPKYEKASKTVWLASSDKDARNGLIPFGWMLAEVNPVKNDTAIFYRSESSDHRLRAWHSRTSAKIAQYRREHEKRFADRQAQIERERLDALEDARRQQILDEKLRSLTLLARELEICIERDKWEFDKDAFWKSDVIESWLTKLEEGSDRMAISRLSGLFDRHFPGALKDPDKTEGKKNKPAFKDRVRRVAKALNALKVKSSVTQ
jgi:CRISPR-associated protein Csm5